jgi:hypothetical protein
MFDGFFVFALGRFFVALLFWNPLAPFGVMDY